MKPLWHQLPESYIPAYCTWEEKNRFCAPVRRFDRFPPFEPLETYTPLYTTDQVLAFGQYAVDKYANQNGAAPVTPVERLRHAAKEFEQALNAVGTVNRVGVDLINIRSMEDKEDRYAYVVRIENTTTEQVYP